MTTGTPDIQAKVRAAQGAIIDRLADCESLLAELYTTYRDTIPELRDFWERLAKEETTHKQILLTLHSILDRGRIFYNLDRFNERAITEYIEKVTAELDAAKGTPAPPLYAVSTALALEVALIDTQFYDTVTSDAPEFSLIARQLSAASRKHIEHIQRQHMLLLQPQASSQSLRPPRTRTHPSISRVEKW
jgi:hypothetical protein